MKLRNLTLASLVLASCAPGEDTAASADPGTAPTYEGAPTKLAPSYAILQPLTWSNDKGLGGFEFSFEATEQSSGGILRAIGGNLGCNSSRPCQEVCAVTLLETRPS